MVARAGGLHTLGYGDQLLGACIVAGAGCKHTYSDRSQHWESGLGPAVGTLVVDVHCRDCSVSMWAHGRGGW